MDVEDLPRKVKIRLYPNHLGGRLEVADLHTNAFIIKKPKSDYVEHEFVRKDLFDMVVEENKRLKST